MIALDFSLSIAFYSLAVTGFIFLAWIFSRKGKDKDFSLDPEFIWFCDTCSYTYINTKQDKISTCPCCSSYNKK